MICAIGDIHGCYDPLKTLINWINDNIADYCHNLEYIFVGDYIDRGPSSKEVLDFLIDLDASKTLLMGNHEDMLLMYHYGSELYKISGNFWLTENNGGLKTVKALDPNTNLDKLILEETAGLSKSKKYIKNNGEFNLEKKYEAFFNDLKYACVRTIKTVSGDKKTLFSHSVPNRKIPVEELISCSSFEEFHKIRETYRLKTKETNLWNREFLTKPFGDYIIVHGHTPTFYALHFMQEFLNNEKSLSYNEKAIEDSHVLLTFDPTTRTPLQMDIDTGAVYGKNLSAVFFPETQKELSLFKQKNKIPMAISFSMESGYWGDYIKKDFCLGCTY